MAFFQNLKGFLKPKSRYLKDTLYTCILMQVYGMTASSFPIKDLIRLNSKYRTFLTSALVVIILDLAIKMLVHSNYQLSESTPVIPNFFNLTYVRNLGAAFGLLAQSHPEFRKIFFAIMPPIACIVIFFILKSAPESDKLQIYSLSFIMGGALGNYLNRMFYGYVIDFLDFHLFYKYNWPAFNIADVAIVSGVGMLLFQMLRDKNYKKQSQSIKTF